MPTNKPRVALTTQLIPGQDDDLIDWLEGLQTNRNQATKAALRNAIGLLQHGDDLPDRDTDDLRAIVDKQAEEITRLWAEIERLRGVLANVPRLIESAQNTRPAPAGVDDSQIVALRQNISASFEAMHDDIQELFASVRTLNERIAAGVLPAESTTSAELEAAPRLDDQELALRATKLKKATW